MFRFVNAMQQNLKLTVEVEDSFRGINFSHTKLSSNTGKIEKSWFKKSTDCGVCDALHYIHLTMPRAM